MDANSAKSVTMPWLDLNQGWHSIGWFLDLMDSAQEASNDNDVSLGSNRSDIYVLLVIVSTTSTEALLRSKKTIELLRELRWWVYRET
jgi:hypothetical protein